MTQNALTVITRILPDQLGALRQLLDAIGDDIKNNPHIPFHNLSTTHFARWVIVPPARDGGISLLAFESNHDGTLDDYLKELVANAGTGLDLIYGKCEGYPVGGTKDFVKFKKYMKAHCLPAAAFYIGYRGQDVRSVKQAIAAREAIERFLDDEENIQPLDQLTPQQIQDKIQRRVRDTGIVLPSIAKLPFQTVQFLPLVLTVGLILVIAYGLLLLFLGLQGLGVAIGIALAPVFLAGLFLVDLRIHEIRDEAISYKSKRIEIGNIENLVEREDYQVQNQLTHLVPIKRGPFRLFTLRLVLWAINLLAKYYYTRGYLGSISTIHFARWVILDDRRLLFFSNFDGSWENYLGDFVDKASIGLTGVWSNTVGFPRARWLVLDGAQDVDNFKHWTRDHQIRTQVWYSAVPNDSVQNIQNDLKICKELQSSLVGPDLEEWLRRL